MNTLLFLPRFLVVPSRRRVAHPAACVIADVRPHSRAVITGMIRSAGTVTLARGPAFHFTLVDGSGELDVLFPGRTAMRGLAPGARITVEGEVGSYDCKLALRNPRYRIEPTD